MNIFKIKTEYCLQILKPKVIKLIGNTKTKKENDKNVPHLGINCLV